jgi:hypothetical protein
MVAELGEVVWVVDFNRQSLDGVVPNRPRSGRGVGSHRESETRLSTTGSSDSTTAPNAGGFFLGDYDGLTSSGTTFKALFDMSQPIATAGRSDLFSNSAG